ncbi:hypothetical protein G3N55_08280 [Dissulfurirhabdus thermomarina]|uniref:YbbR-like domain-containing protein n=1 Tax=Dissulfurirhabdus thermomarina TaxID=1765737 RepID=A0A6N9TNV9_DISTH|nr:CdaR family protein [Dissulfurirhabdus thermomarina]NDY42839.1 hypothetical protein [Dissulfurirhabdus thermomarina]NMX24236.1 hypothetical protein [Dissulfurirhabdus thermomarina]
MKNWTLKLIALVFAVLMWAYVSTEQQAEIGLSIPLEIVNVPKGYTIANDLPASIDIRVAGPRSIIKNLPYQRLSKVIDLSDARPGKGIVHVTAEGLSLPGGVRPVRITPSDIEIVLERLARKSVPVKAVVQGKVAPTAKIYDVTVDPPVVVLSGPESELRTIKEIATAPVDVSGADADVIRTVPLDVSGIRSTPEGSSQVKVTVKVGPVLGTKRVGDIPVRLQGEAAGASWWPKVVTVTAEGPLTQVRGLGPKDFSILVPAGGLAPGVHEVRPRWSAPDNITLRSITPEFIKVTIPRSAR